MHVHTNTYGSVQKYKYIFYIYTCKHKYAYKHMYTQKNGKILMIVDYNNLVIGTWMAILSMLRA